MSCVKHKSDHIKVFIFNELQWHPFVEGGYRHSVVINQSSQLLIDFKILKGHGLPGKLGKPGSRQPPTLAGWSLTLTVRRGSWTEAQHSQDLMLPLPVRLGVQVVPTAWLLPRTSVTWLQSIHGTAQRTLTQRASFFLCLLDYVLFQCNQLQKATIMYVGSPCILKKQRSYSRLRSLKY